MKKFLYSAIMGLTAFTIVGSSVALAQGFGGSMFGETMFEDKADLIGLTSDELEAQLDKKTMPEILDENGVTHQQMYELKERHMLSRQADLLGITVEELESKLDKKTYAQLLDEEGISHVALSANNVKNREEYRENMSKHFQEMLDNGDISLEEMQQRYNWISNQKEKDLNNHKGRGMMGMMSGHF